MASRALFGSPSSAIRKPPVASAGPFSPLGASLGAGRPLDRATRDFFEPRFGVDFGGVRVHDHARAHEAAGRMDAQAFAFGHDIAFGRGEYAPETAAGRELIAHELAHTLQQRAHSEPARIFRKPKSIPGWNFRPSDYLRLVGQGRQLSIAADSAFFPARLQDNLLNTLRVLLGPAILPAATDGVNAMDLFHGHVVIRKDPATAKDAKAVGAKAEKFRTAQTAARNEAIGRDRADRSPMTSKNLPAYTKALEKLAPSFTAVLDEVLKVPGAAVMYHTYEFINPYDLESKGEEIANENPRRHYVTPLDTNQPKQYTPPSPDTYEKEYTHITKFVFLVDDNGRVHVRPFNAGGTLTTLELSTITGTPYPEPLDIDR
jgi:hypothetical protein